MGKEEPQKNSLKWIILCILEYYNETIVLYVMKEFFGPRDFVGLRKNMKELERVYSKNLVVSQRLLTSVQKQI